MLRAATRVGLIIAMLVSFVVVVSATALLGLLNPTTWATAAASMAVIAAAISAWGSQRILELQEDEQKPFPYPSIDVQSRYGLVQLRVSNYGKAAARDVRVVWDSPLLNSKGEAICFTNQAGAPDISILLPGEHVSVLIDGSIQLFQAQRQMDYSGRVEFKTISGRIAMSHPFFLSMEKYRQTLTFAEEEPKTQHELQKIPSELQKISRELSHIHNLIQSGAPGTIDEIRQ